MLEGRTLGANITLEEARRVAEATIEAARTGPPISVSIVDTTGTLVYFAKMDSASWNSVGMSQNKGYTAMRWLRDTRDLRALFEQLKLDITWFGDARYAPLEGGVLIRKGDGEIVGAIGISGRLPMDGLDDEALAQVGAKAYFES